MPDRPSKRPTKATKATKAARAAKAARKDPASSTHDALLIVATAPPATFGAGEGERVVYVETFELG